MIRAVVTAIDARGVYVRTSEFGDVGPIQWIGEAPAVGQRVLAANTGDEATPDLAVLGNVRSDSLPLDAFDAAAWLNAMIARSRAMDSRTFVPPYFPEADWLWQPIPDDPALHANSATWAGYLSPTIYNKACNLYDYSVELVPASHITWLTPRYTDFRLSEPWWYPLTGVSVPIPEGTEAPPSLDDETAWGDPGDGHVSIIDPVQGKVISLWQGRQDDDGWLASYAGVADLNGDGQEYAGSSTATNISRYAAVITADEMAEAAAAGTGLNHTMFWVSNLSGPTFVYPASKSDGRNAAGVATPIPQGTRMQLDPAVDVDAIVGLNAAERVIAKTLQTHGAVLGDNSGNRCSFIFEKQDDGEQYPGTAGAKWAALGLTSDYQNLSNDIPWSDIRFLASWNGEA